MLSSRPHHALTEGTYYAPTKTPMRAKGRVENLIYTGARTAGPKGKNSILKTPFGPSSTQPNRLLKDGLATQGKAGTGLRNNRPLGDKTPFPNRANNHFSEQDGNGLGGKIPKLVLLEVAPQQGACGGSGGGATPESLQRPSSTRRHSRSLRKSLVPQNFKTPVNNGRHWDVGELDVGSPEVEVQETILEDDLDEVEYMPPNTLELAYQPPLDIDLPDYRVVGEMFRKQAFSVAFEEVDPPELSVPALESVDTQLAWLSLPDIDDDDPFRQAQAPKPPTVKAAVPSRVASGSRARPMSAVQPSVGAPRSGVTQVSRSRPATAASKVPPKPVVRPASVAASATTRRPGTSASSRVATSGPAAKPTLAGSKPADRKVVGASRPMSTSRATTSHPTTARSTPAPRGPKAPSADPVLFKEVSLDLDDDFMFEV